MSACPPALEEGPRLGRPPLPSRARLAVYRGQTTALLRRYFRLALDAGRLPSLLGREVFRARISSHHAPSFEDAVIFVHDVERCVEALDPFSRTLLARVVLQDYGLEEAARLLHCGRRKVARRLPLALDLLSELLLERALLRPRRRRAALPESCQEGKTVENPASDGKQSKYI